MRVVMSELEMIAADKLDNFARERAIYLLKQFESLPTLAVDIVRLIVCELAFQLYLPFVNKFSVGDKIALRQLLDRAWLSLTEREEFPDAAFVQDRLNDAELTEDDWDDLSAADAVAAICIIDACLGDLGSNSNHSAALASGMEMLFVHEVKKMMDDCARTNGALEELAVSVESGKAAIPSEQSLLSALKSASNFEKNSDQFLGWAIQTYKTA